MDTKIKLDPDFLSVISAHPGLVAPPERHPIDNIDNYRYNSEKAVTTWFDRFPISELIKETKHTIQSNDGAEIAIHEFARTDVPSSALRAPAFLYLHGGGVASSPIEPVFRPAMAKFALDNSVRTFGVEYRLSVEHPFPTPVEDCYAALRWLTDNADTLNVDPNKIGLYGESGGATLVTGLSLIARDRKHSPPIALQMLSGPMIDDRSINTNPDPKSARQTFLKDFNTQIAAAWAAYLGADRSGKPDADVSPYAAANRATDCSNLPSTYIECGGLDQFLDEALEYASKLSKAEVEVEIHVYPKLPHCFDLVAPEIPASVNMKENRLRAIKRVF